eukprot:363475-Chlamydomonas_euryale.AAC.5
MCDGFVRRRFRWWHHFSGLLQVAWPHKIDPLAKGPSSSGGTCLGQAGLAGCYVRPCSTAFKKPQQLGRLTQSCARRGRSG